MGRGGFRKGAGRPKKAEKTKPIRIPERLLGPVLSFVSSNGYKLPLYSSSVAAGFPSPADDHVEDKLDLNELLVKHPTNTFLVRASGESMLGAGINSDDVLVVDKSIAPTHGKIVVAAIDGHLTVKRLKKMANGSVYLMPENDKFPPIEVREENDVHIWGVVRSVIHMF